ncbi:MAG: NAD(P)-dependent alcohol dehydrogenase [Acidimicrobiia bacterium]|nr:MAG: NAD(P)-dependent alcohol dehydrogenase [Acidimicrobiia bacterium]
MTHTTTLQMRAVFGDRYGTADRLDVRTVPVPELADDRVLIRVHASSVNAYDHHMTTGTPLMARSMAGIRAPKRPVPGSDVAGVIEAVGAAVEGFEVGDRVFGGVGFGAWAEFAVANPRGITHIPEGVSFEDAAATPMAGLTALQALRDLASVQPGERVIVNGASGGVGTFAVQIARALGATVTAVCSTGKVDQARSIGADRVIDYTAVDFTTEAGEYDVLLDNAGTRGWFATRRTLVEGGRNVTITGPKHLVFGPMRNMLFRKALSMMDSRTFVSGTARTVRADLEALAAMLAEGSIRPVIERTWPLEDAPRALAALAEGHAAGKHVIVV